MFKNYIKTAWRNLWKGRVFNSMNIIGLSVAIASSALLLLTVFYEFSYDRFHQNLDNIYQVYFTISRPTGPVKNGPMPVPLTPTLKADYPDVKYITRLTGGQATVDYGDKHLQQSVLFADPDYFKMFTFPIIKGNKNALAGINDIILTRSSAKALFGDAEPIGKTLVLKYDDQPRNFIVSGVTDDYKNNSSISTDLLVRFENMPNYKDLLKAWDSRNHTVYVQLNNNTNVAHFEEGLKTFVRKYLKADIDALKRDGAKPLANGERESLNLAPFSNIHFDTEVAGTGSPISKVYVIALLVIAMFILIIACINFVNLSIARSFTRAREIGVRKTLGAGKWQLLTQFWVETVMICLIALTAGIGLASLVISGFKATFRSNIKLSMLFEPVQLLSIIGLVFFITLAAGFYPALLMLRYKTTQVLKGSVNTAKPGKVRNILLIVQFSLATILTICTLISWQQISYLQSKPLGYNKSEVISIPVGNSINGSQALKLFRNQMAGMPGLVGITGAFNNLGRGNDGSSYTSIISYTYKGHDVRSHLQKVDYDFLKTLDIKLLAGRDFSRDFSADSNNLVINEKMAAQINGGKNVLGTFLPMHDNKPPMQVIGIVKDYNFRSLHEEVEPLTLTMESDFPVNYIFARVKSNNLLHDFNEVKAKWHITFPNIEFTGSWLNENTEKQYRSEQRLSTIFISGAVIAILISCIGLLAISIMVIVQRTKEIGIRKVLGSSVVNIVVLLSREFAMLVGIATVIAMPIAWFVMHKWLQGFAYRVSIHWWVFAMAALIALTIAILTISIQAVKAALANPVKSLKSE